MSDGASDARRFELQPLDGNHVWTRRGWRRILPLNELEDNERDQAMKVQGTTFCQDQEAPLIYLRKVDSGSVRFEVDGHDWGLWELGWWLYQSPIRAIVLPGCETKDEAEIGKWGRHD